MRKAQVLINQVVAGELVELSSSEYVFSYLENYQGHSVSLTMPITKLCYRFNNFPPFFEGLLPEGIQLEAMLRKYKLDKHDYFCQLLQVGHDLVGAITVVEVK